MLTVFYFVVGKGVDLECLEVLGDFKCKQNFDQLVEITTNMFHIINGSRDIGVSL